MTVQPEPCERDRERGTMTMELAIVAPVFLAFIMLLAGVGRIVDGQSQVDSAARDAVRAASIARSEGAAAQLAQNAADQSLTGVGWCRGGPQANLDSGTTRWEPGGQISVTVTCNVDLGDLTFIGLPGSKTMTAHATAPIDKYTFRGGSGGNG
jgi:Flp pilus assembly protein TadG